MNDVTLAAVQTRYSLRGFLRDPRALIFTVIMPVVLLLLFNAIFHGTTRFEHLRVPSASYYTASIIGYDIMLSGFASLLISVTSDREAGLLKRFRGTPMPRWVYLVAEIGRTTVVVAVTVAVLLAVGVFFYHVKLSGHMVVGLVVYLIAGTACFCALGLAAARICTTTETASAIGPFSTVILAFISGVFIPVAIMPKWLLDVGKVFPLEHVAQGLQRAFLVPGSTGITAANLGVIVLWGIAGVVVAVITFGWEPLAAGSA
jgi:ABC-2 type transport system permease protein